MSQKFIFFTHLECQKHPHSLATEEQVVGCSSQTPELDLYRGTLVKNSAFACI